MKKTVLLLFMTLAIGISSISGFAYTAEPEIVTTESENPGKLARLPIIDWRYKIFDGIVYRRLYNYTRGEWIGVWEICP